RENQGMAWNDERVELLKKLWADGLSASQIAGRPGGVTRNAVIGKVNRLGLSGRKVFRRAKSQKREPRRSAKRSIAPDFETKPLPAPPIIEEIPEPDASKRTDFLGLQDGMCRYMIGDTKLYCGHATIPRDQLCPYHRRLSIQIARPAKKQEQTLSVRVLTRFA